MEDSSNSIIEERRELMVSSDNKTLELRTAHFIKPSRVMDSIDGTPVANLPKHCLSSLPTAFEPNKWPVKVNFNCWRYPQKDWTKWVIKMSSLHGSTWKKAGIFEAIMNSTYRIERNNDLVFGVAEKWCDETKSFIFPWGEATVSLEDVMILGGYSVLGSPVFAPIGTVEMVETLEKLDNARKELHKSTSRKATQSLWLQKFMDNGSEIEHEAVLALWLSRFVLPSPCDAVVNSAFPIAVHLARGTRIALGPAVLASIYRDLSCLKRNIVASTQLDSKCDGAPQITLRSPLTLVQVWVWERFLDLRPKPKSIENGEPRLALWHELKCKVQDVRSVLDSAKERFTWRPYVNVANFYGDTSMWVRVDSSSDDQLRSFARCLRASELVGLDCIEQYLPHRVALQFGMDQDVPRSVPRSNESPEIAWSDYNNLVAGKLYIPSKLFEADVTDQYSNWWKHSMLILQQASKNVCTSSKMVPKSLKQWEEDDTYSGFKIMPMNLNQCGLLKRKEKGDNAGSHNGSPMKRLKQLAQYPKSKKDNASFVARSSSMLTEFPRKSSNDKPDSVIQKELNNSPFPPGFSPIGNMRQVRAEGSFNRDRVTMDSPVPPGFTPKSYINEEKLNPTIGSAGSKVGGNRVHLDSDDEDQLTIADMLKSNTKFDEDQLTIADMLKSNTKFGEIDRRDSLQNSSGRCSVADNELPRCELMGAEKAASMTAAIDIDGEMPTDEKLRNNGCRNEKWLRLEARISRLERLLAETKGARKVKSSLVTKRLIILD